MSSVDSPRVESFVVRFVKDSPRQSWHGVVVHVQTNEEKSFTDFADAIAFIARYVQIGDLVFKTTADSRPPSAVGGQSGAQVE